MKKYIEKILLKDCGNTALRKIAEECCRSKCPGDLIEIGAGRGETTKELAIIGQRYNKKVWTIDPYKIGTQNCKDEIERDSRYGDLKKEALLPYPDVVSLLRYSSLDPELIQIIKNKDISFAYVDGLHTEEACFSDIMMVSHTSGIIAVDDYYSWNGLIGVNEKRVRSAVDKAYSLINNKFDLITSDGLKIKPDKKIYFVSKNHE